MVHQKTKRMKRYERQTGRDLTAAIREAMERGHSTARIAADLGVSVTTLYNWMRTLGLTVERRAVVHGPGE